MGRNQHSKDRMHITPSEWQHDWGGHKDDTESRLLRAKFRRLPYTHCSYSFVPFDTPVCTGDGTQYEFTQIVPFLHKHKVDPVTGDKLSAKELIRLHYARNAGGDYHCPITFKVFTPNSRIVAVKTSGNVYSWEAVDTLNVKAKHWKDLLTDEPFTRADIIQIQDPTDLDRFNIDRFYHVQMKRLERDKANAQGTSKAKQGESTSTSTLRRPNAETRDTLSALASYETDPLTKSIAAGAAGASSSSPAADADDVSAAHFSTGVMAAGLTSTVMAPVTEQRQATRDEQALVYERVKKKGYVRLVTNYGPVNIELHCDLVPKTCDNFIQLCDKRYYDNTKFHRLIRNFMMQGGDPTGGGSGGDSVWGGPFADEFAPQLSHTGRGIVSMANQGTDTNRSQFFITFRSCKHLDRKHSIFGRVVGGLETLTAVERIKVDKDDRPEEHVTVMAAQVFVNPFDEARRILDKDREALRKRKADEAAATSADRPAAEPSADRPTAYKSGVGKYIRPATAGGKPRAVGGGDGGKGSPSPAGLPHDAPAVKKSKAAKGAGDLTDFSAW